MHSRLCRLPVVLLASLALAAPAAQAACTPPPAPKPAPKPAPGRGTFRVSQFCTAAKEAAYLEAGYTCVDGRLAKK